MKRVFPTSIAIAMVMVLGEVAVAKNELGLEPAEFLTTRPGTTLVWKDMDEGTQNAIRIAPRQGNKIHYVTESGETRDDYLMCWYCDGTEFDESEYAKLWPLKVGKKVKFIRTTEDETRQWVNKLKVDRTEKIRLPIGEVDTYVIETKSWIRGAERWYGTAEYWFAPELGWVVKTKSSDIYNNNHEFMLVDVRVN